MSCLAIVMLLLVHVSHELEQQNLQSQHWVRSGRCGASRFHAQSVQTGNLLEQLYFRPKSLQSCRPWEAPAAARVAAGVAQAAQLGLGTSLKS